MKTKIFSRYKKILADTLTPVGIYNNLRHESFSILLESSDYHGDEHNFSFIAYKPIGGFSVVGDKFISQVGEKVKTETVNQTSLPIQIDAFLNQFELEQEGVFPFITNGLFGYITYDAIKYFEDISLKQEMPEIPLLKYFFYEYVIAFNHFNNEMYIFNHSLQPIVDDKAIDDLLFLINKPYINESEFKVEGERSANLTGEQFLEMVKKGIGHCYRGDVFQIVLSRRFRQQFSGDDFLLYRALRSINPSPYLFYFNLGDFNLFGSSPEAQIIIKGNKVTIHPIAGTFRRTGDDIKDLELAKKLEADPKENAEHVMLVDLARNDLSRNGKKVAVEVYKEVQFYSHVIHLVSKVSAEIPSNLNKFKLVSDTFPAGTLSGAPKYRAIQLIDEMEKTSRGPYGGAIGHLNFNGDFNSAIMIRTFFSKNQVLSYQAGAGIVADSIPEMELQEVENKLAALNKAINLANEIF
ncbi:MAG: anthranilate synthase component I family protein [Bacteroidetes bacterium]|nr:anthranilate synthase component I family protein [Bacteroidota bacterium]